MGGRTPRNRAVARNGTRTREPVRLEVSDAASWRAWLSRHHAEAKEVWLVFAKKHAGKACIGYEEALDEALCHGWIDSVIKSIDGETYLRKFTPRSSTTNWSRKNLKRVAELIAERRMTASGLAVLGVSFDRHPPEAAAALEVPPFVAEAIARRPRAAAFWQALAPSFRKRYLGWITSAKKEEARQARLARVIGFLEEGKKSVMV